METLKYCKVRDVKSPVRAHSTDAGIDFFIPSDLTPEVFKNTCGVISCYPNYTVDDNQHISTITLLPGQSVLIPSGIKVKVPDGYMLMYDNKSGIASKKKLLIGAKVIDIGYEGECHINLHNVSTTNQTILAGDKICQGILVQIGFHVPEEVASEDELFGSERSARGAGGFGSSGTK